MTAPFDLPALKALIAADPDPVYLAALDTLKKGAPGLSETSCAALSRSIAIKVKHAAAARTALPGLVERVEVLEGALTEAIEQILDLANARWSEIECPAEDLVSDLRAALKGDQA